MDDLKSLTVRYLRELARKHLGKGYTKLKTKQELIAALRKAVPGLLKSPSKASQQRLASQAAAPAATGAIARAALVPAKIVRFAKQAIDRSFEVTIPGRPLSRLEPVAAGEGSMKVSSAAEPGPAQEVVQAAQPPAARKPDAAPPPPPKAPQAAAPLDGQKPEVPPAQTPSATPPAAAPEEVPRALAAPPVVAEKVNPPLVEGFFVARMAGELEVRRHRLTEEQTPPPHQTTGRGYEENLGELPVAYEDDSAVLLPRDPSTLFFFWDFRSATRAAARSGLVNPRAVVRVFEGEELVREADFALESRSFYVHGLAAGRTYRVEAHFVGEDGQSRRVGSSTNLVALPSFGPSPQATVRFLRVPWTMPLRLLRQYLGDGRARIEAPPEEPAEQDYVPVVGFAPPGSHPWALAGGPGLEGEEDRDRERRWFWVPPPSGRPY